MLHNHSIPEMFSTFARAKLSGEDRVFFRCQFAIVRVVRLGLLKAIGTPRLFTYSVVNTRGVQSALNKQSELLACLHTVSSEGNGSAP